MNKHNTLTPPHPKEKNFLLPSLQQQREVARQTNDKNYFSTHFGSDLHVVKLVLKKKKKKPNPNAYQCRSEYGTNLISRESLVPACPACHAAPSSGLWVWVSAKASRRPARQWHSPVFLPRQMCRSAKGEGRHWTNKRAQKIHTPICKFFLFLFLLKRFLNQQNGI